MATTAIYGVTKPVVAGDSGVWGGYLNTGLDTWDNEIARPRIPFVSPTYNVGGTTTLDLNQTTGARVFVFTVSGASTLAFSNVPSSSFAVSLKVVITNGGAFALTWPASVVWLAGGGPNLRVSGVDVVELVTKDAGTTWYASRMTAPGVIYQSGGLTTTSTSAVSLGSITTAAGLLGTDLQQLRIRVAGSQIVQSGQLSIQWGGFTLLSSSVAINDVWNIEILIVRTGAATQLATITDLRNGATPSITRVTPNRTLSTALLLDFRGSVTSGGTFRYDAISVEYLAV